jgi:hypothetical protein
MFIDVLGGVADPEATGRLTDRLMGLPAAETEEFAQQAGHSPA